MALSFTCPRCGGHTFGYSAGSLVRPFFGPAPKNAASPASIPVDFALDQGLCHGYLGGAPCGFSWHRRDEGLYFHGTDDEPKHGTAQLVPRTPR